jgi:hypothetical protein
VQYTAHALFRDMLDGYSLPPKHSLRVLNRLADAREVYARPSIPKSVQKERITNLTTSHSNSAQKIWMRS